MKDNAGTLSPIPDWESIIINVQDTRLKYDAESMTTEEKVFYLPGIQMTVDIEKQTVSDGQGDIKSLQKA